MQNIVFDITTIQIIFMVQNKILQQKQQFKQICCRAEKKEVKSNNRHGRSCDTVHIWKVLNCWPNKDFIIWLFLPVWSLLNKMLHRNDHRSVVGYLPSTRKMKKKECQGFEWRLGKGTKAVEQRWDWKWLEQCDGHDHAIVCDSNFSSMKLRTMGQCLGMYV